MNDMRWPWPPSLQNSWEEARLEGGRQAPSHADRTHQQAQCGALYSLSRFWHPLGSTTCQDQLGFAQALESPDPVEPNQDQGRPHGTESKADSVETIHVSVSQIKHRKT